MPGVDGYGANGQEIAHYSQDQVKFQRKGEDNQSMILSFEVTDITTPVVAVHRLVEHRNEVPFGKQFGWIMSMGVSRGLRW